MASDTELARGATAPPPEASDSAETSPSRPDWRGILVPVLLVLCAGFLRFANLDHPGRQYFDEVYYADDSADYLELGVESGRAVHPMVGKWLIAAGIAAAGDSSFGWRVSAAVAGTLTVLALYLVALRLFRRRGVAALAAFLLAIDGIAFTASRISMLDAFLGLFLVVGFLLLLVDRDRQWADPPGSGDVGAGVFAGTTPIAPRARVAAGVVLGLAVATKWSALLAIGGAGLFVLGSEFLWHRRVAGRVAAGWWRPLVSAGVTLVLVPITVYLLSYMSWFANYENTQPGVRRCGERATQTECVASPAVIFGDWLGEQADNYRFHRDLEAEHRYRAEAWTWPVLARPVAYYYESCRPDRAEDSEPCVVAENNVEEILGIGNPAIWWTALVFGYPLLAVGMWRRDWRAWAIATFLLAQFLPWLVAPRPLFLFYTVPLVPFVVLALTYGTTRLARTDGLRWLPAAVAALATAGFVFWWPILAGAEISEGAWRLRILFDSWI
jgi:dolichyl-phosphate-mannose-protein mannosyltransferase